MCNVSGISIEIKNYWIKRLVEWKKRPLPSQIQIQKLRKMIYDMRNLLLNIFIGSQIVILISNKFLVPVSIFGFIYILIKCPRSETTSKIIIPLTILVFLCILRVSIIRYLVILKRKLLREPNVSEDMLYHEQELGNFVLLLESETIHDGYLTFINTCINSSIVKGGKNQPRCLMELVDQNSTSFDGVLAFESDQVSLMLIDKEPSNCWSLAVATLTSIVIALPNVQIEERNKLLRSLVEGFEYVRLVEKTLDVQEKMATGTIAADSAWAVLEMRRKWLDLDLQKVARVSKTSKRTLERLAYKSEEILKGFMSTVNGDLMEINPILNLPDSVIIANSMYKISNTFLLLVHADERYHTASADARLFEKLSVIIADIFAACLSNLPHVILKKCSNSAIEEREQSIRDATRLLGETQGIMEALQKREIPNLSSDQLVYIDEWRALLKRTNDGIGESTSRVSGDVE